MNINQTLNGFRGYIGGNGGIPHLNRFLVNIPTVQALKENISSHKNVQRGLQFSARSATLPSKTISTNAVLAAGPEQKYPYQDVYEDLTVTFLTTKGKDKHLPERLFFEDWIDTVVNPNSMLIGFSNEYAVDITLSVLSDKRSGQTKLVEYKFQRTYPIGIGAIEFAHDSEEIMTFEVTFSYDKWYREEETKIAESKNPESKLPEEKEVKHYKFDRPTPDTPPKPHKWDAPYKGTSPKSGKFGGYGGGGETWQRGAAEVEPKPYTFKRPVPKTPPKPEKAYRKLPEGNDEKLPTNNKRIVGEHDSGRTPKKLSKQIIGKIQSRISAELGIRPIKD